MIAVSTPELNRLAHAYAAIGVPEDQRDDTDLARALHIGDLRPQAQQKPLDDGDFNVAVPKRFAFRHIVGVQFYFAEDLFWIDGHVYYPNSGWGLTSISQVRFWEAKVDWQYGYRGVLSVTIGEVGSRRQSPTESHDGLGRRAGGRSREAREAYLAAGEECHHGQAAERRQGRGRRAVGPLRASHADGGPPGPRPVARGHRLRGSRGAEAVGQEDHPEPYVPLFISPPGQFAARPGSVDPDRGYTVEHGFVLAGHHMQTFTRLPCMESANESARHAVNAIIRHRKTAVDATHGKRATNARFHGSYCDVWSPRIGGIDDLQFLRD